MACSSVQANMWQKRRVAKVAVQAVCVKGVTGQQWCKGVCSGGGEGGNGRHGSSGMAVGRQVQVVV